MKKHKDLRVEDFNLSTRELQLLIQGAKMGYGLPDKVDHKPAVKHIKKGKKHHAPEPFQQEGPPEGELFHRY